MNTSRLLIEHLGVIAFGTLVVTLFMAGGLAWIVWRLRRDKERRA